MKNGNNYFILTDRSSCFFWGFKNRCHGIYFPYSEVADARPQTIPADSKHKSHPSLHKVQPNDSRTQRSWLTTTRRLPNVIVLLTTTPNGSTECNFLIYTNLLIPVTGSASHIPRGSAPGPRRYRPTRNINLTLRFTKYGPTT